MATRAPGLPFARARRPLRNGARALGLRKSNIAAGRLYLERRLLARFGRRNSLPGRVLCYHSVGTPAWGVNDVPPDRFARQLHLALEHGYAFVPAADLARGGNMKQLAVTFDDGIASVLENAAPVLSGLGIPWTLFVVAGWAEGGAPFDPAFVMGWEEVEKAAAMGATIGSHSMSHPRFSTITFEQARYELEEARQLITRRIGIEVEDFAIPFGQAGDWPATFTQMAHEAGYRTIYAQAQLTRPPGTVGRSFVTRADNDGVFEAILAGRFDSWEEWTW